LIDGLLEMLADENSKISSYAYYLLDEFFNDFTRRIKRRRNPTTEFNEVL
jgi:hypothetical protein